MRSLLKIILVLYWGALVAQKTFVLVDQQTQKSFYKKDSASAAMFLDSLVQQHYYFTKVIAVQPEVDRVKIIFNKGKNYNQALVHLSASDARLVGIPTRYRTENLDSLKKKLNQKYIDSGYTFNRVKTKYLGLENDLPEVELSVVKSSKRELTGLKTRGYYRYPKRFLIGLEKKYRGKIYNQYLLNRISQQLQAHEFVRLDRPLQTFFTKDFTQVFLFLEKKQMSFFDGVLGFGNDQSDKIRLNGSLRIELKNMLNAFENIGIYWQKNASGGQSFDLKLDLPYLLSDVGSRFQMSIFRQDSTFANIKIQPSLYYQIKERHKIGVQGVLEMSSVQDEVLVSSPQSFHKKGLGGWYQFIQPTSYELFEYQTKLTASADILSTRYLDTGLQVPQRRYSLFLEHNLKLRNKHWLNLKIDASGIKSSSVFSVNEAFRLGGWNTLRGFNEESILGRTYAYTGVEYRYVIGTQAFFDVFSQVAQVTPVIGGEKRNFYSMGTGFRLRLPLGIMSFQVANGSLFGERMEFKNTKIHWGILARF